MNLKVGVLFLSLFVETFLVASAEENGDQTWWKHAVFYQIYPRSFRDFNNDGNGDIKGITEKIGYLKDTGVTAVWLSPIMKSPQVDQGYDICDYLAVDEMYGTMDDLKELIQKAHTAGLKIIMDFVPNHTSNKHKWFLASENGEEKYKDYYVWVNGTKNRPPNNWISVFKNKAWTWSPKRQAWYYHAFLTQQPDLNYNNPEVRKEMLNVLKFYMDLGVDGFRCDAIIFLLEDEQLRDEPRSHQQNEGPNDYGYLEHTRTNDLQGTYDVVYEWRQYVDSYSKEHGGSARILMTEAYTTVKNTMLYYGTPDGKKLGAHFTFNFNLITQLQKKNRKARDIKHAVDDWLNNIPKMYTSNWVIGNHDQRRAATRFGKENADGFNMLVALLPGIAVTYNGEEIAQEDGEVSYQEGQDPSARKRSTFKALSRDFERTPFQWDSSVNAGFNTGHKPWLPVSKNYLETNLKYQLVSEGLSHYRIYQKAMAKRQDEVAKNGSTEVSAVTRDVFTLERSTGNRIIALAFKLGWSGTKRQETIKIPNVSCEEGTVYLTSLGSAYKLGDKVNPQKLQLKSHECVILDITC